MTKKLTDTVAKSANDCPLPEKSYVIYWSQDKDGFGVRVSAVGDRAWVYERRVNGKTVRRTLGKVVGRGAISMSAARSKMTITSGELELGKDQSKIRQQERKAEKLAKKEDSLTFEKALDDYVERKVRRKDGKPLKARTRSDYLAMIKPASAKKNGDLMRAGALCSIADTPIARIDGDDIRGIYAATLKHGQRVATYAMQVLRAVLNWHGITVPGNPLGKEVAGRDRIVLPATKGDPKPIPPEYLAAWWDAACSAGSDEVGGSELAGDYYRFQLLTGCRGVEIHGDDYGNEPIRVRNVDITGARIVLRDTKNRSDHTLLLSRQALAIAKRNVKGKKPNDELFPISDARKTLQAINTAAGMEPLTVQGQDLRATFASVAEALVSVFTLKRMINHAAGGDVTDTHYVKTSEAQLREGWQKVANFIAK
ncbi:MAG: integrase family protein [Proteobacteria bacterium]|nr:integrase family protein [Pseudomonadota bacterium]